MLSSTELLTISTLTVILGISIIKLVSFFKKHDHFTIISVLISQLSNISSKGGSFKINGNSACITYLRYGREYQVNIPYNRHLVAKMSSCKVFLIKGEEKIDITQQPGIPYLMTASMLGGDKIILEKGDTVIEYGPDQIPTLEVATADVNN